MKDKKYIYESPNGGKTIYRREFGDYDNSEKITMEVPEDYWVVSKPENIEIEYINSEEE